MLNLDLHFFGSLFFYKGNLAPLSYDVSLEIYMSKEILC